MTGGPQVHAPARVRPLRAAAVGMALAMSAATVLISAGPASAHAALEGTSPKANTTLASAPKVATVRFSEAVTGGADAVVIVDAAGRRHTGPGKVTGALASAPVTGLAKGRYALTYNVTADDGHKETGSTAFAVRVTTPAAKPVMVTVTGVKARLSGARVGVRTFTLPFDTKGGEVWFQYPKLKAPFIWSLKGRTATGMLPFAGTYSITVYARVSTTKARILDGRATIRN